MPWRRWTGILAQDNLKVEKALLLLDNNYARTQMEISDSRWICSVTVQYGKILVNFQ